jgi:hypothetical protein
MTTPNKVRRLLSEANPVPDSLMVHDDAASEALFASITEKGRSVGRASRGSLAPQKRLRYHRAIPILAGAAVVAILVAVPVLLLPLSGDAPIGVEAAPVTADVSAPTLVPDVEPTVTPPPVSGPAPDDAPQSVEPVIESAIVSATNSATVSQPVGETNVTPLSDVDAEWVETRLTSPDPRIDEWFGYSVAVDGDRIVVGAPFRTGKVEYAGAVFVFESDGKGGWIDTKLTASDGSNGGQFGMSVAVDGDRIAVGAPFDVEGAQGGQGSVYVFDRGDDGHWLETKLTASDGGGGDVFGSSVAVDGDRVVVGAGGQNDDTGAVYVFESDDSGGWTGTKLIASDGAPRTYFGLMADRARGIPVAADDGRIAVGSRSSSADAKVYVYEPDGSGGWTETKLAEFGFGVDIEGDRIVVSDESAVHIFEPDGSGGWIETKVMISDRTAESPVLRMTQSYGLPVAAADGRVVFAAFPINTDSVSTAFGSVDPAEQSGPVFVFGPEGDNEWTQTNLNVSTHNPILGFVFAVAADGDRVVVGAPGANGAAYVYEHTTR